MTGVGRGDGAAGEISRWSAALRHAAGSRFPEVHVLLETDSTQDEIRRRGPVPGMLVAALRQSAGRGRLGRAWLDAHGEGVALSAAVQAAPPARLMMLAGLAASAAVDAAIVRTLASTGSVTDPARTTAWRAGLKWPNDVLVNGRKIAGVLVEVVGDTAIVGIGINVGQRSFQPAIAGQATSLALVGAAPDRCPVAADVVGGLCELALHGDDELLRRYQARDVLRGRRCEFGVGDSRVVGEVLLIDPLRGIRVRTDDGRCVDLDPARATLLSRSASAPRLP